MSEESTEWNGARAELKGLGDLITREIGGLREDVGGLREDFHDLELTVGRIEEAAKRPPPGFEAMGEQVKHAFAAASSAASADDVERLGGRVDTIDRRIWGLVVAVVMLLAGIVLK